MKSHLHWRYATQKFDPKKKIKPTILKSLLESLRLSPSSYGLQPWKFIVITDKKLRQTLRTYSWEQPQVTDASHLLVLCTLNKIDSKYIDILAKDMANTRGIQARHLDEFKSNLFKTLKNMSSSQITEWMRCQVYLALGMLLCECAHLQVDACPLEGFESKKFDRHLGLSQLGLHSQVLCAIGYRAKDDKSADFDKVRFKDSEIFIHH